MTTIGHVPDILAEVLFKPLLDNNITMSCRITGQSRSAPEGVWVQVGGIEIPCVYDIRVRKGLKSQRKELRGKLELLTAMADNTIMTLIKIQSELHFVKVVINVIHTNRSCFSNNC